MPSIEDRLETARLRLQQKKPQMAARLLRGVLDEAPDQIDALRLLGRIALVENKHAVAGELFQRAIKHRPDSAALRMNLGIAYHGLRQFDEAIAEYRLALANGKRNGFVHFHLGNAQAALGNLNDAAHSYQRAIHLRPSYLDAHYKLADVLLRADAANAAVLSYMKVLELDPRRDDAYVDLGNALRRAGNDNEAINSFRKALALNPSSISALNNLSNALRDHGQAEAAVCHMRRAVALQPTNPALHNGLGLSLQKVGLFDEASLCFEKAMELDPNYANAHYNLAGLVQEQGNLAAAELGYQRAIACDPQKSEAHYRLGCLWLLKGDFLPAWPKYELRWKMEEARGLQRKFSQPAWDGGPLSGKTILLYAEQGLGDTLQFVRFGRILKELGATVFLECQPRLVPLLSRCEGIDRLIPRDQEALPEYDVQAALLSLPGLLGTTLNTVPADIPYLSADWAKVELWKDRLRELGPVKVGIAWQGKPTYMRDASRSIPLDHFARLAAVEGVALVSLQKGYGQDQLGRVGEDVQILDLASELDLGPGAFEDTAAVIKGLDLVITSDTSIAHLAGGLGAPTWVALGYVPEWRWLLEREDSPWYPTMRLFRQPAQRDWASAFDAIEHALREFVSRRRP